MLAEANDSWAKIALRLAVWNVVGWDLETPEERDEILRRYEEALKRANPGMKEDPVEGTRVGIVEDVGAAAK